MREREILDRSASGGGGFGRLVLILGALGVLGLCVVCGLAGLVTIGRNADRAKAETSSATGRESIPTPAEPPAPKPDPVRPAPPITPVVPPAPPDPVRVSGSGVTLLVYSLKEADALTNDIKADPQHRWAVADLEIQADGPAKYGPRQFTLRDAMGREYAASLKTFPESLQTGTLAKGQKIRGKVAFLVRSIAKLSLEYDPGQPRKSLTIQLTK